MASTSEFIEHLQHMEDTCLSNLYPYIASFGGYREILHDERNWNSIASVLRQFRYAYEVISVLFDELGPDFVNICVQHGGDAVHRAIRTYACEHFVNGFDKEKWLKLAPSLKDVAFNEVLNKSGEGSVVGKQRQLLFRENVRESRDSEYLKKIDRVMGLSDKEFGSFFQNRASDIHQGYPIKSTKARLSFLNSSLYLPFCLGLSVILIVVFGTLRHFDAKILDLDVKWIVVAGIPIIIGLLMKGLIKSFKGFGIEIEMNLSEPVKINMVDKVEALRSDSLDKSSLSLLQRMSRDELNRIERLRLRTGRGTHYEPYAIEEYMNRLPRIKFIEIADSSGKLLYLLPISFFVSDSRDRATNLDRRRIEELVHTLESVDSIVAKFPYAISDRISNGSTILDAYKTLMASNQGIIENDQILPVVNKDGAMVGICKRSSIEGRIARAAIQAMK